jgi:hypothetical protein
MMNMYIQLYKTDSILYEQVTTIYFSTVSEIVMRIQMDVYGSCVDSIGTVVRFSDS